MSKPKGWRETSIRELGGPGAVQTGPFGAELHADDYVASGVPLVLIRNIGNGEVHEEGLPLITKYDAQRLSNYSLKAGDIVFSRVGRVGSCFLASERQAGWIISGQLLRVRIPDRAINKRFALQLLLSEPIQAAINDKSVGTTRQSINTSILEQLVLCLPDQVEQRRIAAILDTLDNAIRSTERLIAKLQLAKKGFLQNLLTRGIDESGHLRDPLRHPGEFRNSALGLIPRDWRVVRCSELCKEIVVGIVVKPAQYYIAEGIPILRSANVREDGIDMSDLKFMSRQNHKALSKSSVRPGDVLTVRTGYPGTSAAITQDVGEVNCVDVIISRPGDEVIPDFLVLWVNSPYGKGQVLTGQGGLAQQHFNISQMKKLLVAVPSLREQGVITKIASSWAARSHNEEQKLEKFRLLKQGLMNDLLTGRVRVGVTA
ncbi:MAG: restriction endonuclease subunit S [Streptosporangiaceae bacterium]